jgi:hypothetical protein
MTIVELTSIDVPFVSGRVQLLYGGQVAKAPLAASTRYWQQAIKAGSINGYSCAFIVLRQVPYLAWLL